MPSAKLQVTTSKHFWCDTNKSFNPSIGKHTHSNATRNNFLKRYMPAIFSTKHLKWLHYKCMTNSLAILFIIPQVRRFILLGKTTTKQPLYTHLPPSNKTYNWDDTLQRTITIQLCTYTYNQYQHNAAPTLLSKKTICHPYWVAELRTLFFLYLFHQHKVNPDMKPTRINRLTVVNQKLPCWPQTKLCN